MKKKRKQFDCIEYLSVVAPLDKIDYLEDKQRKYIREYVANKEYRIVGTMRRHGFSQADVNRQWNEISMLIKKKLVQGVVISNMKAIATSMPDAFYKVGQIIDAGGIVVTVDEGRLQMSIGGFDDGEE